MGKLRPVYLLNFWWLETTWQATVGPLAEYILHVSDVETIRKPWSFLFSNSDSSSTCFRCASLGTWQDASAKPKRARVTENITSDLSPGKVEKIKEARVERKRETSRAWHAKFVKKGVIWKKK